jgi:ubiquinone/menaquinone biosynthesis C-methylase UbiE
MSFYEHWVLPPLLDLVMRQRQLEKYRRDVVAGARGRVLEIGVGSGLNLLLYGKETEIIIGLDPSERLLSMAQRRAAEAGVPADLILGSATNIPLKNASMDTVVMTWTLCSISDPLSALREMRRVLKPGGALLFVEHGLSPEPAVERWQHRLTPLWRNIAGGCHLDRKVDNLIRAAGFEISKLRNEYAHGPRPMTYMYEGRALPTQSVSRGALIKGA